MEKTMKMLPPPRKVGDAWEYGSLIFWAEGGGIYCEDQAPDHEDRIKMLLRRENPDGSLIKGIPLPKWDRIRTMFRKILKSQEGTSHQVATAQQVKVFSHTVWTLRQTLLMMDELYYTAKGQGDLTQAETQKYYRLHEATRPHHFVVPAIETADMALPD